MRHEILLKGRCVHAVYLRRMQKVMNWPFLFPLPLAASASRTRRCTALEVCGKDIHQHGTGAPRVWMEKSLYLPALQMNRPQETPRPSPCLGVYVSSSPWGKRLNYPVPFDASRVCLQLRLLGLLPPEPSSHPDPRRSLLPASTERSSSWP